MAQPEQPRPRTALQRILADLDGLPENVRVDQADRSTISNPTEATIPQGFHPFEDARNPTADPNSYPPLSRWPFISGARWVVTHGWSLAQKLRNSTPLLMLYLAIAPALLGLWVLGWYIHRHYNGWLAYTWYLCLGMFAMGKRRYKCVRMLQERPDRRFDIDQEYWFVRGCVGTAESLGINLKDTRPWPSWDQMPQHPTYHWYLMLSAISRAWKAAFWVLPHGFVHLFFWILVSILEDEDDGYADSKSIGGRWSI